MIKFQNVSKLEKPFCKQLIYLQYYLDQVGKRANSYKWTRFKTRSLYIMKRLGQKQSDLRQDRYFINRKMKKDFPKALALVWHLLSFLFQADLTLQCQTIH